MDFGKLHLFNLMHAKMSYSAQKHDIIAHNVANADTPEFEAQAMREVDFQRLASLQSQRLKLRATSAGHIAGGAGQSNSNYRVQDQRKTFETTPVENNIALEEQIANMAGNKQSYEMTVNLYKKTASMFKTAIGQR